MSLTLVLDRARDNEGAYEAEVCWASEVEEAALVAPAPPAPASLWDR